MKPLTGSVGVGGGNAVHDVALVQAMLVLAHRPATADPRRGAYLAGYDGAYGAATEAAIRQFQADHPPAPNAPPVAPPPVAGLLRPGDAALAQLAGEAPEGLRDLWVLDGGAVVYAAAPEADRDARVNDLGRLTFQDTFRAALGRLVRQVWERHRIALGVARQGDRRTFQTQDDLLNGGRNVTHAGPGESNHNFGQAADMGFAGLRWLRPDGTVVTDETAWLHRLDARTGGAAQSLKFWDMLRAEGESAAVGLHRGPASDRPHLQAWRDADVSMAARLGAHLTRVTTANMRWEGRRGAYSSDLGFGGRLFPLGSATAIWNGRAGLTRALLDQARRQPPPPPPPGRPPAPPRPPPPAATEADLQAMLAAIRADWNAADTRWREWTAR